MFGLYLGCILFGFGVGNLITLPGLIMQQEFPRRDQGVEGQKTQAGGTVDDHVVQGRIVVAGMVLDIELNCPVEASLPSNERHKFDLSSGKVNRGGCGPQSPVPLGAAGDDVPQGEVLGQHLVRAGHPAVVLQTQGRGGIALRIQINHEDVLSGQSQGGGNIDRCRCLPHAAFLIRHGQDPGHEGLLVGVSAGVDCAEVSPGHPRPVRSDVSRETSPLCVSRETGQPSPVSGVLTVLFCTHTPSVDTPRLHQPAPGRNGHQHPG